MCACVFTHTPVRAHRYEYVCVHVCLYIHLCMLMAWYVYTCVFAHTPVRAHGCGYVCVHVCLHIHLCILMGVGMCVYMCACTYTCVHAHGGLNVCQLPSSTILYFFVGGGVSP